MRRHLQRPLLALALTLIAATVGFVARGAGAAGAKPVAAAASARTAAAGAAYTSAQAAFRAGRGSAEAVYAWSSRWYDAQREGQKGKALATAAREHLARMQTLAADVEQAFTSGAASEAERDASIYYLADATLVAARLGVVP